MIRLVTTTTGRGLIYACAVVNLLTWTLPHAYRLASAIVAVGLLLLTAAIELAARVRR